MDWQSLSLWFILWKHCCRNSCKIYSYFFGTNPFWTLVTILPLWSTTEKNAAQGEWSLYCTEGSVGPKKKPLKPDYFWVCATEKHTVSKPRASLKSFILLTHKHALGNAHTHGCTHAPCTHTHTCTLQNWIQKRPLLSTVFCFPA